MSYLVLDVGGTAVKAGLSTAAGVLSQVQEVPSKGRQGGTALVAQIAELIQGFAGYERIGISTAGQVDAESGSILYANNNIPGYTGTPLRELLERRFGVPVCVENDVNAAALGEMAYGAARGWGDFLCLTYGTGIGGAAVLDGALYRGHGGGAGEFGHLVTHGGGLACACGQRGCYEQYASATALVRRAQGLDPVLRDGRAVLEAAGRRKEVRRLLEEWIEEAVLGLAGLVHVFHPGGVVLGGGVMGPSLAKEIGSRLRARLMESYRGVRVVPAALGNSAGMMGVTYLCGKWKE